MAVAQVRPVFCLLLMYSVAVDLKLEPAKSELRKHITSRELHQHLNVTDDKPIPSEKPSSAEINEVRFNLQSDNKGLDSNISTLKGSAKVTDLKDSNNSSECILELCESCINRFRHIVYYSEASFAYLKLRGGPGVNLVGSNIIVGENLWVWTFWGKEGSLEFLNWPIEFGIWSMGLLTSYVVKEPLTMELSLKSGNCSNLEVGVIKNDLIISNALKALGEEMMIFNKDKYGPSFYCYKTRKYIQPHFVYMLCKHIICPLEALKYNCCSYAYNITLQNRTILCIEQEFEYDTFSWILPTVAAVILFASCPLFLFYLAHLVSDGKHKQKHILGQIQGNAEEVDSMTDEKIILLDEHHHVTLSKTLFLPIKRLCLSLKSRASDPCQIVMKRVLRLILPFLSLLIIGLQVFLDYFFLYEFVHTSITKGVPMGFRSLVAGYKQSKSNFLPYLGGPFVAIGIYLFVTCCLLILPRSISSLLLSGFPGNTVDESNSPLVMRMRTIEQYGSMRIRHKYGYNKLYTIFIAQFFMMINVKFWKHAVSVQIERWNSFCLRKLWLIVLPLYIVVCVLELLICVAFYGSPIISFGFLIVKAYCGKLQTNHTWRNPLRLVFCLLTIILIAFVVFFLFMFCTIFMDAILFISRMAMFTFTGIVVYPKVSYGYIIFAATVVYYIWQSFQDFALVYQRLLKDTIYISESLQRANDRERLVVKVGDFKGIKESLFEEVIENHFPRRKQVFLSALKVFIVLVILGLLINILVETDGFRELHVIMHVGTALFICALPQIMKSMCRGTGDKFRQKRFRRDLEETITNYMGYFNSETSSCESDNLSVW